MSKAKLQLTNKEHSERSIGLITKSASKLFGSRGYHDTSIDMVLEATGLTKGAFYHHFKSKQDLFEHVYIRAHEELTGAINPTDPGGKDGLTKMLDDYKRIIDYTLKRKLLRILIIDPPSVFTPEKWNELRNQYALRYPRYHFGNLVEQGFLEERDVEPLSVLLVGGNHEALRMYSLSGEKEKIYKLVDYTFELIRPFLKKGKRRVRA